MHLTYFGHSCFSVLFGGKRLLFDPFVTGNALAKKAGVELERIPADYILLSHGHVDHVLDAAAIAQRTGATVIAGFEVGEWIQKQGVTNVHELNHGGAHDFPFGKVKMVNAIHSSTMPDGSPGGNPGGFVLSGGEKNFYYSGDTALTYDMQLIPRAARLDFAVLCIGDNFTMGVEDAVQAAEWVGVKEVVGVHYDTFPPIRLNREAAREAFAAAGMNLHLPPIGETIEI